MMHMCVHVTCKKSYLSVFKISNKLVLSYCEETCIPREDFTLRSNINEKIISDASKNNEI